MNLKMTRTACILSKLGCAGESRIGIFIHPKFHFFAKNMFFILIEGQQRPHSILERILSTTRLFPFFQHEHRFVHHRASALKREVLYRKKVRWWKAAPQRKVMKAKLGLSEEPGKRDDGGARGRGHEVGEAWLDKRRGRTLREI